ncbi:hypothetical protein PtA15_13A291 [Puccinia triticina]|uniref:Uncharacterized protein n=1 Tax=Puccinia triticina TaxID=208348 RepID=A0ABY7CZY4_9BASI|nr:uncharacterized protein PtA15_13A291 [Puccinia triticina]WAQ90891.1 hypothetical protein PtA15_13A291 [Puccinia triticina]
MSAPETCPCARPRSSQIFTPHLRHVIIRSIPQFEKLYEQVMRFRSIFSNKLNHTLSRSHTILTIHVTHLSTNGPPSILANMPSKIYWQP